MVLPSCVALLRDGSIALCYKPYIVIVSKRSEPPSRVGLHVITRGATS